MVVNTLDVALRGIQFLFTLLAMALIGSSIADKPDSPDILNYDMFCIALAMVYLIFYVGPQTFMSFEFPSIITLVVEALIVLFLFLAGIITAALLTANNCNHLGFVITNQVAYPTEGSCREAQAGTAFIWFLWATFCVSLAFAVKNRGGANLRGPKGPSNMSQV